MTITGGSSLSEEDIARMVKDAEEHAAEDKKRREEAETRNQAEQLVYSNEKLIKENEDKLPDDVKSEVQADIDALKTALAGDDIEAVNTASDKLMQSQAKLGEAIYATAQQEPAADDAADSGTEDVMDAEVIDEEEGEKKPGKKKTKDGE